MRVAAFANSKVAWLCLVIASCNSQDVEYECGMWDGIRYLKQCWII